jgi:hypothetical protein
MSRKNFALLFGWSGLFVSIPLVAAIVSQPWVLLVFLPLIALLFLLPREVTREIADILRTGGFGVLRNDR